MAHRIHDADLGPTFLAVVPEGKLLSLASEVDVGNKIKVWAGGITFVVVATQYTCGACFSTCCFTDSVAVIQREQMSCERQHLIERHK